MKQKSLDVIYVLQAGFIGCWGEWYFTRNYAVEIKKTENYQPNEAQKADRIEIMKLLLKAVPGRMVQLRTPALKQVYKWNLIFNIIIIAIVSAGF
jgi:hypothetical protein